MEENTDYITMEEVAETMAAGREFPDSPSGVDPRRIERLLNSMANDKMPLVLEEVGDNEEFGIYALLWLPNGDLLGLNDGGYEMGVSLIDHNTGRRSLSYVCSTGHEAFGKVKFIVEGRMAA